MTIVITYLADDNARNRRRARRQAQREQQMQDDSLARRIAHMSGNNRTVKATSLPSVQVKEIDQTACCIPQVALYCAGHRTVKDVWQTGSLSVRGRQKTKGKSIPLYMD